MWKLRPLGYISWTAWPHSKSTQGPRLPPPGIFFSYHVLCFFEIWKDIEHVMLSEYNVFLSFTHRTFQDSLDPDRFPRSPAFARLPRDFLSRVVKSRPAKAPSCDLPTRDRISSKGPAKYGLCGKYNQQNASMEWLQWLQAGKCERNPFAMEYLQAR